MRIEHVLRGVKLKKKPKLNYTNLSVFLKSPNVDATSVNKCVLQYDYM